MAAFSQLKVGLGNDVISVDKVSNDNDISKYIQSKCDVAGRDVSTIILQLFFFPWIKKNVSFCVGC